MATQLTVGIVRKVQFGNDLERQQLNRLRNFMTNTVWAKDENDCCTNLLEFSFIFKCVAAPSFVNVGIF